MPKTLGAVILLLLAVLPGVPGERKYSSSVGLDWREETIWRIIRIALISVSGLVLYIFSAVFTPLPLPLYVLPENIQELSTADLPSLAVAYVGHLLFAYAVGFGAAQFAQWGEGTPPPAAWDGLVNEYAPEHWVVVKLENGETIAGMLEAADIESPKDDRDILLAEPALHEEATDQFVTFEYQYIHLQSENISSVAVYYDPEIDDRLTPVNEPLFQAHEQGQGEEVHRQEERQQKADGGHAE